MSFLEKFQVKQFFWNHSGGVIHIYVIKLGLIGLDNGLPQNNYLIANADLF